MSYVLGLQDPSTVTANEEKNNLTVNGNTGGRSKRRSTSYRTRYNDYHDIDSDEWEQKNGEIGSQNSSSSSLRSRKVRTSTGGIVNGLNKVDGTGVAVRHRRTSLRSKSYGRSPRTKRNSTTGENNRYRRSRTQRSLLQQGSASQDQEERHDVNNPLIENHLLLGNGVVGTRKTLPGGRYHMDSTDEEGGSQSDEFFSVRRRDSQNGSKASSNQHGGGDPNSKNTNRMTNLQASSLVGRIYTLAILFHIGAGFLWYSSIQATKSTPRLQVGSTVTSVIVELLSDDGSFTRMLLLLLSESSYILLTVLLIAFRNDFPFNYIMIALSFFYTGFVTAAYLLLSSPTLMLVIKRR